MREYKELIFGILVYSFALSPSLSLLRYSSGLCYLALPDYVACGNAMGFYAQQDGSFPTTMEGQFLHNILQACEAGDVPGFDEMVANFDRTKRIVGWQANLLRNVRKGMQEEPDLA